MVMAVEVIVVVLVVVMMAVEVIVVVLVVVMMAVEVIVVVLVVVMIDEDGNNDDVGDDSKMMCDAHTGHCPAAS